MDYIVLVVVWMTVWATGLLAENKNNQTDPAGVRLVGGASRCDGSVQVEHSGRWRDVLDSRLFSLYAWNLKAAAVICGRLDCGSAVSVKSRRRVSSDPLWWLDPFCIQSTSKLKNCLTLGDMFSSSTLVLTCADSVRLVRGPSLCSGRLEVRSDQSWSSVCEQDLDLHDAQVVCRELGCGAPSVLQGTPYGEGEAPVWTSEFQCGGNESALMDCRRSSSVKTCSPGKAVGLTCADPVRLVGGPSRCAGTLEMENQRHWRPVGTSNLWSLLSGSVVCQRLRCGSAVSVKRRADFPDRPMWFISFTCVKSTSGLRDCLVLSPKGNHTSALEVVCSDLLPQPVISLSVSADGVSEAYQQGFRVLMGSNFTITCSVEPQFPGGSFQLTSDTSKPQNRTLPAVNHSAHFLFSAAGHAHRGDYTCVYHVDAFNHSFLSPQSQMLYLTIGASVNGLIIRVVVIVLILLISITSMFFYYQASRGQLRLRAARRDDRRVQDFQMSSVLM